MSKGPSGLVFNTSVLLFEELVKVTPHVWDSVKKGEFQRLRVFKRKLRSADIFLSEGQENREKPSTESKFSSSSQAVC